MSDRKTTRRDFLKGTGAAAAAAGAAALLPIGKAQAERELRIFCWDGYADPRLLDGFTAKYDTPTKVELLIDDPDAINRLRAGETKIWDILNLNQYWAVNVLWPEKLIRPMPRDRFDKYFTEDKIFQLEGNVGKNIYTDDGNLVGMVQRCDTFDFGVNADAISWKTGNDQGWNLFNDPKMKGRYGILAYDQWNVFGINMTAGLDPFKPHSDDEMAKFAETAKMVVDGAKFITDDFVQINLAMLNGEIDAGFSSGIYSLSGARLDGNWNLIHVAPKEGPSNGRGAINWFEVTSLVNNPDPNPRAEDFIEYCQQPETAHIVATASGVLNPVLQMKQEKVLAQFSPDELRAIAFYPGDEYYGDMGFEYRIGHAVQFEDVRDYKAQLEIYHDAKRTKQS